MTEMLRATVQALQNQPQDALIAAFVVKSQVAPRGEDPGEPLLVQTSFGDTSSFAVHKAVTSFDATKVQVGEIVLLGRLPNRRWAAIGSLGDLVSIDSEIQQQQEDSEPSGSLIVTSMTRVDGSGSFPIGAQDDDGNEYIVGSYVDNSLLRSIAVGDRILIQRVGNDWVLIGEVK